MIPIPRSKMFTPPSSPSILPTRMEEPNGEEKPATPCDRAECVRVRALLAQRPKPQVIYRPIETVRIFVVRWWWLLSLMIALGWTIACIEKDHRFLGLVNFVGAFLPLYRQLYVDTPLRWLAVSWTIMVVTFYLL